MSNLIIILQFTLKKLGKLNKRASSPLGSDFQQHLMFVFTRLTNIGESSFLVISSNKTV